MEKIFYCNLMPIALGFWGLLFGFGCYLAESSSFINRSHLFYWLLFFVFQSSAGFFIGILIKRLYYSAYTDGLTGLWNFRYFYETLDRELQEHKICSLIYLDLDNFKTINDTFGHQRGDEVLCIIAEILRASCSKADTIARLGGDEFAVFFPNTSLNNARTVAEKICAAASEKLFPYEATVSIGVTTSWPNARIESFISLADKALYKAKKERNNVILLTNTDNT